MSRQAAYEAEVLRVWRAQTDGSHDLAHLRRVWTTAKYIALEIGGDIDVIEAAAFLHDVINPPKDSPDRKHAARLSAQHALAFLARIGFDADKRESVAHAIDAHSYSGGVKANTLEAQIVQDADRLDALGALGIARCFNVSGQMGGGLFHPDDPLAQDRALDDRTYALDHFEVKLLRIAETLNTIPAQKIAAQRVAFMLEFRDQLLSEIS